MRNSGVYFSDRGYARAALVAAFFIAVGVASCGSGDEVAPVPERLKILLRDGDVLPGDFEILSIESANMAADRSVAVIASRTGLPSLNGVFRIAPEGSVSTVLTPESPAGQGLSFGTVRNLAMADTGEFAFEVGDQIDNDGLFYFDGTTTTVAITGSDGPLPGFEILGEMRVASGGALAFSDGTNPCTIDDSGASQRITCSLRLHYGRPGSVERVEVPNTMTNQKPTAIILQVNESGEFAVGLPARGTEPFVGRIVDGEFTGILARRQDLPGLGILTGAKPRAIGQSGAMAIDGAFDTDGDGERDTNRVLRYHDGVLSTAASTGDPLRFGEIVGLNAVAVDASDRVYYTAEFLDWDERKMLRRWDDRDPDATPAERTSDIAWETMRYGGEDPQGRDLEITEILQTRVAGDGTVLVVVAIGFFEDGSRKITSRQLLRWQNGQLSTLLETKAPIAGGVLVGFQIADLNRHGDLLLIGEIDAKANRALLLLPREDVLGLDEAGSS